MILILMGAPACGKGTQAELIREKYGLKHISTGDLLRKEIERGTVVGKEAAKIINDGNLVPDDMVLNLLKRELDDSSNIVLDGYPRTIKQAEALKNLLDAIGEKVSGVVYLNLEIDEIVRRIVSRRQCKSCGNIFNIRFINNFDGRCPRCSSTDIFQREDDNEAAAKHRIDVYIKETMPVKNFYINEKYFHEVDANRTVQEVFKDIDDFIFKK